MGKILSKVPINWVLISNPMNWVMIWTMAALGYSALLLITSQLPHNQKDN